MTVELRTLTGEELLLLSIVGGPAVHAAVERELDRRALEGPPRKVRALSRPAVQTAWRAQSPRLVA
ncbi:MAG: hypothetical protein ACYTF6_12245 [Planctomycetota bacterium]|jgi:hypothetical protein